jgi:hypothetical protein
MTSLLKVIVHIFLINSINAKFNHESVQSGFFVGRISEGQFEYTDLNGWMTPRKAIDLCENDEKCGGFTYKVVIIEYIVSSLFSNLGSQPY